MTKPHKLIHKIQITIIINLENISDLGIALYCL